ncbi:MAG: AzlD domain-containing protein [Desulfohalobiaceae bacterium]|nr:AzlD domain-containing protein [Desulfohalobiaceae bacterium]
MKVLFIVLGMAVVTYIPRLLPALFMHRLRLPAWFEAWLQSIPYAALGALIFPGILLVDRDRPEVGLTGGLVAAVLAYFKAHIIVVMAGAIGTVLLLQNWSWLF